MMSYVAIWTCSVLVTLPFNSAIKGVHISLLSFYNPATDFACLDGLKRIPFSQVNDDYCDCFDATDEPGTSACPNGTFYCVNKGYISKTIPSSMVDDTICDCCDGSDEVNRHCPNTCRALGDVERQRKVKEMEEQIKGYESKKEYSKEGQRLKQIRENRIAELGDILVNLKRNVEDLNGRKELAEKEERAAKETQDRILQEKRDREKRERDERLVNEFFEKCDANRDNIVTFEELVQALLPTASALEDLKVQLNGTEVFDRDTLLQHIDTLEFHRQQGAKASDIHQEEPLPVERPSDEGTNFADQEETEPSPKDQDDLSVNNEPDEVPDLSEEEDEDKYDDSEGDNGISHEDLDEPAEPAPVTELPSEGMSSYDEPTQAIIEAANTARKQYDEAQSELNRIEKELVDLRQDQATDFGQEQEFAWMKDQCFDYQDRDYKYRLCMFSKVTQSPASGGSETLLGNWENWVISDGSYTHMKYTNGQSCWNGPIRSIEVVLQCGPMNQITSVTEPSRCEYQMHFRSPAVCKAPQPLTEHDEL